MASQLVKIRNIKRALGVDLSRTADNALKCIVAGRIRSLRVMKSRNFIDLIDGSTSEHLQVVVSKDLLKKPDIGAYITCEGYLLKSPAAQQSIEFKVDKVLKVGPCDPDRYPLLVDERQVQDGWFRKHLHLRSRMPHFGALLRVRSEVDFSLQMIMKQMDFFKVQTPILTSNDSEASSDLFTVKRDRLTERLGESSEDSNDELSDDDPDTDSSVASENESFFGKDVFLATSAQLHLESLAASLSRVYCIGPTFRAEHSLSSRHLCEFSMLEAEEANVDQIDELMDRVETIVKFVAQYLSEVSEYKADFSSLLNRYSHQNSFERLAHSKYVRITYSDAISILKTRLATKDSINFGKDINKTHERILLDCFDHVPIFITDYPKELKPFYMKANENCPKTVACFDLIAPLGGEICGGSLREDDLVSLEANLKRHQTNTDDRSDKFNWYCQLREYGSFPHGGFGLGLERLVKSLVGIKNIKDVTPFPRWPGNCSM